MRTIAKRLAIFVPANPSVVVEEMKNASRDAPVSLHMDTVDLLN